VHSFSILGPALSTIKADLKAFVPKITDHCPQIYDSGEPQRLKEDFLYLQSISSICFPGELENQQELAVTHIAKQEDITQELLSLKSNK